jgi:hypothetical protein
VKRKRYIPGVTPVRIVVFERWDRERYLGVVPVPMPLYVFRKDTLGKTVKLRLTPRNCRADGLGAEIYEEVQERPSLNFYDLRP